MSADAAIDRHPILEDCPASMMTANSDENFSTAQPSVDERRKREIMLDKTLADTFPASDPLSSDPDPETPDAPEEDPSQAA